MNKYDSIGKIYEEITELNRHLKDLWLKEIVFGWRWWLGVALTILPWVLWLKVKDNRATVRLLFVGLVVGILTNFLDVWGLFYGKWYYEAKIFPITSIYVPWDYSLFPVSIMLLLQYKPDINAFLKALVFAFFCAFVFEPFFIWIKLYKMMNWSHWYSFIIYIILYLIFNKIYCSKLLRSVQSTEKQQ